MYTFEIKMKCIVPMYLFKMTCQLCRLTDKLLIPPPHPQKSYGSQSQRISKFPTYCFSLERTTSSIAGLGKIKDFLKLKKYRDKSRRLGFGWGRGTSL